MENSKLTAYQKYQLRWMLVHGISIEDLIDELTRFQAEDPDGYKASVYQIFKDWESNNGFGGELWVCEDECETCGDDIAYDAYLTPAKNKIEVPCTAGTLCAEIGGDPRYPEIYTYLRRADDVEIDITSVRGDGIVPNGANPDNFDRSHYDGLSVYLYKDTAIDGYTDRYRLSKEELAIEVE